MKHAAVLFDMNGVLVDDEQLQEAAFRRVLEPLGLQLTPTEYITYFIGKTDEKGLKDYAAAKRREYDVTGLILAKGKAYRSLAAAGISGYKGMEAFVRSLSDAGARLAIVTSSMQAEAETVLNSLGLVEYFPVIIAAEDINNGKPDPEGYLKGAHALSVAPADCVVVEDAPSGIRAGKAAGMYVLAVTNTHDARELAEADLIVEAVSSDLTGRL